MKSGRIRVTLALLVIACGWLLAQPFRRDATRPEPETADAATTTVATPPPRAGATSPTAARSPAEATAEASPSPLPESVSPGPSQEVLSVAAAMQDSPAPIPVAAEYSSQQVRQRPPRIRRHRVVDGDTLPLLALRYLGSKDRADELFEANRNVLEDPQVLPIDQWLNIPPRDQQAEVSPESSASATRRVSTPARNSQEDPWVLKPPLHGPDELPKVLPALTPADDPQSPWRQVPPHRRLSAQGSS